MKHRPCLIPTCTSWAQMRGVCWQHHHEITALLKANLVNELQLIKLKLITKRQKNCGLGGKTNIKVAMRQVLKGTYTPKSNVKENECMINNCTNPTSHKHRHLCFKCYKPLHEEIHTPYLFNIVRFTWESAIKAGLCLDSAREKGKTHTKPILEIIKIIEDY